MVAHKDTSSAMQGQVVGAPDGGVCRRHLSPIGARGCDYITNTDPGKSELRALGWDQLAKLWAAYPMSPSAMQLSTPGAT